MACDTTIGAPVTVTLNVAAGIWLNTGLTVNPGECLQITCPGTTVKFGVNSDQCAYPEGVYSGSGSPCAIATYDPTAVLSSFTGDPPDAYVTLEGVPYSLIAKISNTQPAGTHLTGTLRPTRSTVFPASTGGTVWLAFNDNIFGDNSGSWQVTLQRLTTIAGTGAVITLGGGTGTGQGSRPSTMTNQIYQSLNISFPNGYEVGVDLTVAPGLYHTDFTSVRVQGPYRAYLSGTVLHIVNDAGELASGTPLAGVDILRIGT